MTKILLIVFIFAGVGYSQTPTPTPPLTAEQKAKAAQLKKQRLAAEKLLPTKMSGLLYNKFESSMGIRLYLTSHHVPVDKSAFSNIEICFDLIQHFQSENEAQNSLIEDAVFVIDRYEIKFKVPKEIPPLQGEFSKNSFSRFWMFRVMLSFREVSLLKKSHKVFIKWNKGKFEINKDDLKTAKEFIDDELAEVKSKSDLTVAR